MIIPFFIPHAGCLHQCVFCNQKKITGREAQPDPGSIPLTIESHLKSNRKKRPVHVAFYGGSFTALPVGTQRTYLAMVQPFIASGAVESIRLSTRPDCVSPENLAMLAEHRVRTIELGAQSMDDAVLARSGRGHTAADTIYAIGLLKERNFSIGLQLMPGLPGDSPDTFRRTVDAVVALKPDFARLYPAVVIAGTPLEIQYQSRRYAPLPLDDAVAWCKIALLELEKNGIAVIRIGLQPTEELARPGTIVAGPYHPAFRQLVESSIMLDGMRQALATCGSETATLRVHPSDLPAAIGQHRSNIRILTGEFKLRDLRLQPHPGVPKWEIQPVPWLPPGTRPS